MGDYGEYLTNPRFITPKEDGPVKVLFGVGLLVWCGWWECGGLFVKIVTKIVYGFLFKR